MYRFEEKFTNNAIRILVTIFKAWETLPTIFYSLNSI